jgi:protein kinase A/protein kinase X
MLQMERMNEQSSCDEEEQPKTIQKQVTVSRKPPIDQSLSLDHFEIYTTLGTGTFGRVKQVRLRSDSSRTVSALKIMKKFDIIRLKQVEHIKSEKNILSEI